ncbi:MAG: HAD family hydrolase [Eubacterium sp.]
MKKAVVFDLGGTLMNNIKWLFFDIGSTLVDETRCYEKRYEEISQACDISKTEFEKKVTEFAKQNKNACDEAIKYFGVKKPKWHKELEHLYPESKIVLGELAKEYKLGIIANQSKGSSQRLENWGIAKHFDVVVASAEEGCAKPDLKIFQIAIERAKCKPNEAVMIGDRLDNDIIPAKKMGMKTVWVRQGFAKYQSVTSEAETPDFTVEAIKDIIELL